MATTPLSQAVLQGMDPNIYRPLGYMQTGNELFQQGSDSSPTSKWGAVGRLAQALSGTYLQNSATSDLAKTIAGGKKSATDQLMAALESQKAAVPSNAPAMAPSVSTPNVQPNVPQASAPAAPITPEPGSPNAQVAARFPAEMSPGTAASPLPNNAPSPLDTAQYPTGPVGGPSEVAATDPVAAINNATQPRGIRNNNALNIEDGPFAKSQPGYAGSDGRFAKFQTPEHGVSAANALLDTYDSKHGLNTVAGIVNRWAPPTDGNNTMAYASDVAGKLGIDPNAPVPPAMRPQLIAAMAQHENGTATPGTSAAPVQLASAGPQTMNDADPEAPPKGQQVAEAGQLDVHKLMAVLQNPYADDTTKQLAQKLLLNQLTPKEDEFASSPQGIYNKRTGDIKSGGAAATDYSGLQGKDLLTAVQKSNPAVASQVTAIIEGRAPYPSGSRLNPVQQQIKELVTQVDPTFESGNSGARIKVRNEFNAGGPNSPAAAITAGNTAIQHLGHLSDEAEKLGNADSGIPGNNLYNTAKNAIAVSAGGGVPVTNFDSIRNKYIEEATKFYRGTGGNEADLQRDIASLNSAQSPSQLRDVIKTQSDLMQSKVNSLQERWKHGMGPLVDEFPIVHPESQSAIDRINQRQAGKTVAGDAKSGPVAGAPAVGVVMKGHKFLGGDPSNPSSWQAVQ